MITQADLVAQLKPGMAFVDINNTHDIAPTLVKFVKWTDRGYQIFADAIDRNGRSASTNWRLDPDICTPHFIGTVKEATEVWRRVQALWNLTA